jgi:hypothetical protein
MQNNSHPLVASPLKLAHIPDVATVEGLFDIVMVGNILEFSKVFSPAALLDRESPEALEERNVACWRYRQFMGWFASNHTISIDGSFVNPWYIAHRCLIEFGTSLCAYKEVRSDETATLTASKLRKIVTQHIKSDWPTLLPRFLQLLESPTRFFRWTGPKFVIHRRDNLPPNLIVPELEDLPISPVFSKLKDKELAMDVDVSAEGDGELGTDEASLLPSKRSDEMEQGTAGNGSLEDGEDMDIENEADEFMDAEDGDLVAGMSATTLGPRARRRCKQSTSPYPQRP